MDEAWVVLGVKPCSGEELEKAYRKALRKSHPDTGGTNEQFIAVQKAYKLIKDSSVKALKRLHHGVSMFDIQEEMV